jgi:hypothetical protein
MTKVTNATTARITVKGLGIMALNSDLGRFEEILLKAPNHKIKIKVVGPTSETDTTQKVWFDEDVSNLNGVKVDIFGGGSSSVPSYQLNTGGPVNRLDLNQNNHTDFGWIPNISEELNGARLVRRNPPVNRVEVVELYIKNALFSAKMPGPTSHRQNPFFMKYEPNSAIPTLFGFMAPEYVGEIESDEVTINIEGVTSQSPGKRPHVPGHPYEIGITNVDSRPTNTMNDLQYIYQFLMHPVAGMDRDLEAWARYTAVGVPPIDGWDYCHGGFWGESAKGIGEFYR